METNGLCLEEYRDFLRQGPRSVALENGRMAQVFYVPAAGAVTEVEVPEGCCQISGDNVEGFILTWWGIPMRTAKKTVPTLDLFRLAAVLLVVMNHTSPLADVSAMADFWLTRYWPGWQSHSF